MNITIPRALAIITCIAGMAVAVTAQQGETPGKQPSGAPGGPGGRERRGPGGPGGPGGAGGADISTKFVMKGINRATRTLLAQVTDASKRDENLKLINDIQRGCVLAKGQPLEPEFLKNAATDAEKARIKESYRAHLFNALRLALETEALIADNKGDAAKAKLDEFKALRNQAHTELGVKED